MDARLPTGARCVFSAAEVDAAVDRIAAQLAVRLWDARPVVVCLMNGGLPFTADLLRRFYFDLELDYMHLTRYQGVRGGAVRVVRDLDRSLAGRTVLLVDDVLDEGLTLRAAQDAVTVRGATEVVTAVLVRKDVPDAATQADYEVLVASDEFLVGRGMDCDGAYRQLSGIYSLGKMDAEGKAPPLIAPPSENAGKPSGQVAPETTTPRTGASAGAIAGGKPPGQAVPETSTPSRAFEARE